ncbi:MAG: recombinase family protein, partial [Alistipes sp.]|nr:recombinase family protein [Alistipes sp.]
MNRAYFLSSINKSNLILCSFLAVLGDAVDLLSWHDAGVGRFLAAQCGPVRLGEHLDLLSSNYTRKKKLILAENAADKARARATKNYLALARVSSDEQEHGFSLDIQEDALREWAAKNGGNIAKMYRVAETAHKSGKRKTFHEMIDYARKNKGKVHGLLFYKVDRAARNM